MFLPCLAVDVDCGGTHTLILSETSEVYGCGGNAKGQLGLGPDRTVPELLLMPESYAPIRAERFSCGFSHSMILHHGELWVLGLHSRRVWELSRSRVLELSSGGDECLCAT
ncbi:unnamed protein product [Durusdinium trenchii]